MQIRAFTAIQVIAVANFLFAFSLSTMVIERLMAAAWYWYKFHEYSDDGHINLSFSAGLIFSGVLVGIFGVGLVIKYVARRWAVDRAVMWSRWTLYVCAANVAVYWLLGTSVLNVWRD